MRPSPSIVPGVDRDTYLVLDDFGGHLGLAWRETDVEGTDLETVISDLLQGQYCNPVRHWLQHFGRMGAGRFAGRRA